MISVKELEIDKGFLDDRLGPMIKTAQVRDTLLGRLQYLSVISRWDIDRSSLRDLALMYRDFQKIVSYDPQPPFVDINYIKRFKRAISWLEDFSCDYEDFAGNPSLISELRKAYSIVVSYFNAVTEFFNRLNNEDPNNGKFMVLPDEIHAKKVYHKKSQK